LGSTHQELEAYLTGGGVPRERATCRIDDIESDI
jgi:hypothetical protein